MIGFLTLLYSCSPMTKESYLQDYKSFINEVGSENSTYNEKDWSNADEKFNKYSGEWYNKFKDEILWKEQIVLAKYEVQYNLYKYKGDAKNIISDIFGTYNELEKKVKYYADNDMTDDIDFLIKQANEIGGTAVKMLDEILVDLDVEYKAGYSVKLKVNNRKNE
jgi:hypothetical protein